MAGRRRGKGGKGAVRRHPVLKTIAWAEFALILIPLACLVTWCFVARWSDVVPSTWTLRGVTTLAQGTYGLWGATLSSIILSLFVAVISVVIAVCTARAIVRYGSRWRAVVELATFLPIVVPATVFGMGSHIFFIKVGLGNSLIAVVIVMVLCAVPWAIKMMVDVMATVGDRLEQQARVLGAGRVRAFVHGVLPSLAPGVISSLGLAFIMSSSQYFLVLLLGGGQVKTLATLVFPLVSNAERCIASSYGVYFIVVNTIIFLVFQAVSNALVKRFGRNLGT